MTEKKKMLSGRWYDPGDAELETDRRRCRDQLQRLNREGFSHGEPAQSILKSLLGEMGEGVHVQPPFFCDYGYNIRMGNQVHLNFSCTILDVCEVQIGDFVLVGPNVQIYTPIHPIEWEKRSALMESGKPVTIGSHVWIGGGAILNPGVTVGSRSVIGSGSVVTRSIPEGVFAAGNPCRPIRRIG